MSDKISRVAKQAKPYITQWNDDAITRRGAPAPAVAEAAVFAPDDDWQLDDGSFLDSGLYLDSSPAASSTPAWALNDGSLLNSGLFLDP